MLWMSRGNKSNDWIVKRHWQHSLFCEISGLNDPIAFKFAMRLGSNTDRTIRDFFRDFETAIGCLYCLTFIFHQFQIKCNWIIGLIFLHAKPWIPGGEISIFTAVIHLWISPLRQFARARTIDEYDVTIPVSYIRVTSQINCGDVTILNQKRLSLATMAKSAIDNCFSRIVCSGHQIACKQ